MMIESLSADKLRKQTAKSLCEIWIKRLKTNETPTVDGVVQCGAVWCGVVRCGVAWRGVVWSGVV